MKLEKIKLKDVIDDLQLNSDELKLLKGGDSMYYCANHACTSSVSVVADNCKYGYGICQMGVA